ncbi:MAG: efflux RND transporter periplasmic adaptor subunit [Steroidobacteraceae bacterium]|jgi:RND family efflux transporter MFP subunit|nr:efflux RND transporter periplasmic adaptor subunit [Steroidobacteraceae bacterium]
MSLDQDALQSLRRDAPVRAVAPTSRSRRWIWAFAAAATLVAAWLVLGALRPLEVEVGAVTAPRGGEGTAVLNASGYVVARRLATVSSKVTGQVATVSFEEGAAVEAGQVLATLDDALTRAALAVAQRQQDAARTGLAEVEVRLAEAMRERDRLRQLRDDRLVSESALDAAEANAASLAARLETARAELSVAASGVRLRQQEMDDLVIRAPFEGVVISKDAQPGEMVSPISAGGGFTRTGIATIVDMDSREVEVDVNEAYINRVTAGQRAEAVLDAYPQWRIPARVLAIVPAADRQKATVRVRISIDELDPRILPDMGAKVRFLAEPRAGETREAVAAVPASAVVGEEAATYVWRVEDGRARRVPVVVELEEAGSRDVLEGLASGDRVIVSPPATLEDGDRVRERKAP